MYKCKTETCENYNKEFKPHKVQIKMVNNELVSTGDECPICKKFGEFIPGEMGTNSRGFRRTEGYGKR